MEQELKQKINAEKKERLIQARNIIGKVFHDSKEYWCDNYWCSSLARALGELDNAISKIGTDKPKGVANLI